MFQSRIQSNVDGRRRSSPMTGGAKKYQRLKHLALFVFLSFVSALKTGRSWLNIDKEAPGPIHAVVHKKEEGDGSPLMSRGSPANSSGSVIPNAANSNYVSNDAPWKMKPTKNDGTSIDYSSLEWIPVPPNQQPQKQCVGPLQHCCLGQCRQAAKRLNNMEQIMLQSNQHVHQFQDLLIELDKHTNHDSQNSSCNLWFHGDSQSSDHFVGAFCQLFQLNYTMRKCSMYLGREAFGEDRNWCEQTTGTKNSPDYSAAAFYNPAAKSCPRVALFHTGGQELERNYRRLSGLKSFESFHNGGVLIFNPEGVHCQQQGCIQQRIASNLLPALKGFQPASTLSSTEDVDGKGRWLVTARETEPQHFNYSDGLFRPELRENVCMNLSGIPVDSLRQQLSNWRNEELAEALNGTHIPIIPLFDALAPLWQLHWGHDCTHYCYTPWRLDITWNGLVHILQNTRQLMHR